MRPSLRRALPRYAAVGAVGAVINQGVFSLFYYVFNVQIVAAGVLAALVAVSTNYLGNEVWTFGREVSLRRWGRFHLVSGVGIGVHAVTLALFAGWGIVAFGANLLAIGTAMAWNFAANYWWTWMPDSNPDPEPSTSRM